jgi:glycosyltransferase involved in cell wall biosynthesis
MSTKIKVVFGLPSFLTGGTERQLLKQLHVYDFKKFDVTLITLFELPNRETMYALLPREVTVYKLHFSFPLDVRSWMRLYATLRKVSPDVVVSSAFFANTAFRLLKPFFGYGSITREHNTYIEKNRFQKLTDHILSYLSYKIVGISQTVVDFASAQAHIPKSKFISILNGIELEEIKNVLKNKHDTRVKIRRELGITDSQKIVLNVGRLKKQKNQQLLIDGFILFQKKYPEYVLCIVGDGIERPGLERQVSSYGAEKIIKLVGHKENVYDFFMAADIFILTSRHEGGPNAVLEALAFELPVISTPIAGVNEYIQDRKNGFYISYEPEDVARVLSLVANSSKETIDEIKKHGCTTVEQFDVRRVAQRYMSLIEECAASKRSN